MTFQFHQVVLNYKRSKRNQLRGSKMLRLSSKADTFILQLETRTTYFQNMKRYCVVIWKAQNHNLRKLNFKSVILR